MKKYIILTLFSCSYRAEAMDDIFPDPLYQKTFTTEIHQAFLKEINSMIELGKDVQNPTENNCLKAFHTLHSTILHNPIAYTVSIQWEINQLNTIVQNSTWLKTHMNLAKIKYTKSEIHEAFTSLRKRVMESLQNEGKIIFPELFVLPSLLEKQPNIFLEANKCLKNTQHLHAWMIFKYILQQDEYNALNTQLSKKIQ